MGMTLAQKIIAEHLVKGVMIPGNEIGIRIDQTLIQDATGTMACLEFEAMGISRVKTEKSVAYVDHNTLQTGFENADDHKYIQSVAAKYGMYYSRPGNGICHQVHYERFGVPGKTLLGADSHTSTCGGLGMLAIGAGGMDVAVAMGGGEYFFPMPRTIKVELSGSLSPGVSAKDIILELLKQLTVKGGVGYVMEYGGEGLENLSVPQRCTIANMGAELGSTTSIFPSDYRTKEFLNSQGRVDDWSFICADEDAEYDRVIKINLDRLVPMAACPHSPDKVRPVFELSEVKVDQVCIGSCTNSSLSDMLIVAAMLKNKKVADGVSLSISPGSKQVLSMLADCGALTDMIDAGARVLECACGPCIGNGFSPNSGGISLRTFNKNFSGRTGTADAQVYIVSPETAVASALSGFITDPTYGEAVPFEVVNMVYDVPKDFRINDGSIIAPMDEKDAEKAEIVKGPNIKPFPEMPELEEAIITKVLLKLGDNVTTDHIMPAGPKINPYRSNIPYMSKFCFSPIDPSFTERAKTLGGGIIVGGQNYGQGSSREHAALVPMALGVKAVIAKSFARIHEANLVNAGILPLIFVNPADYDKIEQSRQISIGNVFEGLQTGEFVARTENERIKLKMDLPERQRAILRAGGLLKYTSNR